MCSAALQLSESSGLTARDLKKSPSFPQKSNCKVQATSLDVKPNKWLA